ncbi:MAG TPA: 50S ribosomal protein L3 [Candidatus Protoclostridium stercorigallinarum]|uniref:Large ribosomal subunit protein uL3 n=1 Tax=Candidatus Protoclostridium stercorigallinarum TaxID=2838741 RepID=A0A9D1TRX6_9FIRM|nr:50S ribosomal protein L3 [Candidatus Protoclostridium stercorigallinarum]
MEKAILGKKVGMTQIFSEKGEAIPVTVVKAGPVTVIQVKTQEKDGYAAVKVAFEDIDKKRVNKPDMGQFAKAGCTPKRYLRELKLDKTDYELGSEIKCDSFAAGDMVDVTGITKGHGFSGTIKRWNHHRLKMTHGVGPVHREVGSTGANSTPSRKIKGLKSPGRYGHERVTIQNLEVVKVDAARDVILIRGAVPGPRGSLVTVKSTVKK